MKMAKAPPEEVEKVLAFVVGLRERIHPLHSDGDDEKLGKWVRENAPPLERVAFGYDVLIRNACDPNLDYLEFRPDIRQAMRAAGIKA